MNLKLKVVPDLHPVAFPERKRRKRHRRSPLKLLKDNPIGEIVRLYHEMGFSASDMAILLSVSQTEMSTRLNALAANWHILERILDEMGLNLKLENKS